MQLNNLGCNVPFALIAEPFMPWTYHLIFSARCNIYISRLCYDVSVHLSVCLWRKCIGSRCMPGRGEGSSPGRLEGSSRAMLATARPPCFIYLYTSCCNIAIGLIFIVFLRSRHFGVNVYMQFLSTLHNWQYTWYLHFYVTFSTVNCLSCSCLIIETLIAYFFGPQGNSEFSNMGFSY